MTFFHFDLSWLLMMRGGVRTVSSFSRAASSSVCGPCRTSSYFTWNASDRCWCRNVKQLKNYKRQWEMIMSNWTCCNNRMETGEWRCRTWWSSRSQAWTWRPTWWRGARAAGASPPTGRRGDGLTGWAVTRRTTFMTCTQCATITGPCRADITQVTEQQSTVVFFSFSWKPPKRFSSYLLCCVLVAHCKNSIDGQWYCFDDSDVQPISEDDVCKQTGYILFYQRRATIPSWSANSSVGGNAFICCIYW